MLYNEDIELDGDILPEELNEQSQQVLYTVVSSNNNYKEEYQLKVIIKGMKYVEEHGNIQDQEEYDSLCERLNICIEEAEMHSVNYKAEHAEGGHFYIENHLSRCPTCSSIFQSFELLKMDMLILSMKVLKSNLS